MEDSTIPALAAFWLGMVTSMSPCPLATNVAATAYIGKNMGGRAGAFFASLFYTLGRALAYMILAWMIVAGPLSLPETAFFLQNHIVKVLGPVLLVSGLYLLGIFSFLPKGPEFSESFKKRLAGKGLAGAFLLGFLFALAFCPVSAVWFFGSVIPLCLETESRLFLPLVYGVGTALPVVGIALALAYSAQLAGKVLNKITLVELWFRRIAGGLFIIIGLYFLVRFTFGLWGS